MEKFELRQFDLLEDDFTPLAIEAENEGHRFMRRLKHEWDSGVNRFQGSGEFILSARIDGCLVAAGGPNADPYASIEGVGRLRHVYVARSARRQGVGAILVRRIMADAAPNFSILRLRTTTAEAAGFYERLGFQTTSEPAATHVIKL